MAHKQQKYSTVTLCNCLGNLRGKKYINCIVLLLKANKKKKNQITFYKYYNKISNIVVLDQAVDIVLTGRVESRTNWLHVLM